MAKIKIDPKKISAEEGIKSRFTKLDGDRTTILKRARDCAALSIPSILPADGHTENDSIDTPYQSLGARLVNSLASKLLLTLLPPNNSFFRLFVSTDIKEQLSEEQQSQADIISVQIEQEALKAIEEQAIRVSAFELFKSVIVTGSALGVKTDTGLKTFNLADFVVQRDRRGNPIEIITTETVSPNTLDPTLLEQLQLDDESKDVVVYTRAVLKQETWIEYQYVNDVLVENSEKTYKKEAFPYLPLRWSSIGGHNYGVGLIEQYLGDFRSLEACYQLLIEHAAVAGKTIFGIKAGSVLDINELSEAENGDVIQGDLEEDLTVLRVDKGTDIQYLQSIAEVLQRRLEQAFLSASSVARDSDRTSATEIRYMAADLEQALGGVYSVLSQEFQNPLANLILNGLKNVDMQGFEFVVVTGIDSLGRSSDLEKIMQFTQIINQSGLTEAIAQRLNIDNLINDLTTALSLPTNRYIKSQQQLQQEQQQAQQDAMVNQGVQAMAQAMGQGAGQQVTGTARQQ